ncbi:MAG: DEAD/DEAH box helicase [Anaerolineae bacterium]|nr:DEAD/DEAH box helicase [Anaerolineae bacterium]
MSAHATGQVSPAEVAMTALQRFAPPVRIWFEETFGRPTAAQEQGWPPIQAGQHTLILSPTGSGKTLAAFLWAIDGLFAEVTSGGAPTGVRLLYVSPLKALNNDIERNLRTPLEGVREVAARLGQPLPELRVAVRTGDTPGRVRLRMLRQPPHILITTPESLYLMLTGPRAREVFRTLRTVIVDEIHTVAGNKRGVHLALTLERLAHIAEGPVQRIGLSATQRPLEEVARFLGGQEWRATPEGRRELVPRPVTIVDARHDKALDLKVVTVVGDFRELDGSIWPTIEQQIADLIRAHRTTLVFTNGRRQAERLAAHLSELLGTRIRAHHGSMAAAARLEMEADLKAGRLPALVGTSSLELGIDIGAIDLVVQVQSPKGVARGLQRVGRSGHLVGQTSVGRILPTHPEDLMEAAAVAGAMRRGEVEETRVPENCLDVLAQQIVATVSVDSWRAADLYDLVRQSYPYRDLPRGAFDEVLAMLAGKYPGEVFRELRARLDWDRATGLLRALPGSRYLATASGGTIADRGTFAACLPDGKTRLGELDEEFVFERRVGDTFALGSQTWRVLHIGDDRVVVEQAPGAMPTVPFWRGDVPWRPYELGLEVGRFRRLVAERLEDPAALAWLQKEHALDERSAENVLRYVAEQMRAMGAISSDRTIIVELFRDPLGDGRIVIHSPFGGRVNAAWALALRSAFHDRLHTSPECQTSDDGILLRFPESEASPPLDLVTQLSPEEARERILTELPDSALFGAQFRQNAARALLMPRARRGRRTPFWLQRLRAKDLLAVTRHFDSFPIIVETYRDCLRDVLDLEHLLEVLKGIREGRIRVVAVERATPSPVAASLLRQLISVYMYEWDAPKGERNLTGLLLNRELLQSVLGEASLGSLLRPEAIAEMEALLQRTAPARRARSREELALILHELGDLSTEEVLARTQEGGASWLEDLAREGRIIERAIPTSGGPARRWILAEEASLYEQAFARTDRAAEGAPSQEAAAFRARTTLLERLLATHGPLHREQILARYAFPERWLDAALQVAIEARRCVRGRLTDGRDTEEYCLVANLQQARRRTLALLRREVEPVPLAAYADFLARWQHVHPHERLRRPEGLRRAIGQLRALPAPALLWTRDLLPARMEGFRPSELEALCQGGEVTWVGSGSGKPGHLRARFLFRGEGSLYLPAGPDAEKFPPFSEPALAVLRFLQSEGACFTAELQRGTGLPPETLAMALLELVSAGLVANDSLHALHELARLREGSDQERKPFSTLEAQLAALRPEPPPLRRGRLYEARRRIARRQAAAPQWVGRWSLVHRFGIWGDARSPEEIADRRARQLLARYGIVSRDCLDREDRAWPWADLYAWLEILEMRGEVRRGCFVQGLAGPQFALPEAVERLREWSADAEEPVPVVVNAWDPAGLVSVRLLAELEGTDGLPLALPRRPSSYLVLQLGQPLLLAERWGRSILTPVGVGEAELIGALRACLGEICRRSRRRRLTIETWNGDPALGGKAQALLEAAGCYPHAPAMEWMA